MLTKLACKATNPTAPSLHQKKREKEEEAEKEAKLAAVFVRQ